MLVSWFHHGRFRSQAAFVCTCRGQPAEASSGKITRRGLNPFGDRQLGRPGWQSVPVPIVLGFLPGDPGGDPPGGARVQVALLEVNAAVAA